MKEIHITEKSVKAGVIHVRIQRENPFKMHVSMFLGCAYMHVFLLFFF